MYLHLFLQRIYGFKAVLEQVLQAIWKIIKWDNFTCFQNSAVLLFVNQNSTITASLMFKSKAMTISI